MPVRRILPALLLPTLLTATAWSGDWSQFRGPGGMGVSEEKNLPVKWSATENIAWKVELPGPGASSPMTIGDRVYVTAYSGYGVEPGAGDQKDLRRHLLCIDRRSGATLWSKTFEPRLPEHQYQGEGAYHGYAASTPTTDGERLYVFFGKSGVYCFDLEGKELWHVTVGDNVHGWGSGCSPVLLGSLLLINASVECGALIALNKLDGKEVWRGGDVRSAWNTPLVLAGKDRTEVIVSTENRLQSFNAQDGKPLWNADGVHRYVCPSVVAHDGIIYAIGGGHTSLAVRAGGTGDVTATHGVWRQNKGSNVGSPIYHDGHLYWANDGGGIICCQDAATGATVFQERLTPESGTIWTSPVLADGKLYIVSQRKGTYVVACQPKFELLAHNLIEGDDSRTNASPAISHGQILLRTDKALYCIGR
ncbi:MAG: PQQ-binding-like beta-propeller repeat protein [Planctomycetales bacterium]